VADPAPAPPWGLVSELRLGISSQDVAFEATVFPNPLRHRHERGASLNAEVLFASPAVLRYIGAPRPRVGGSLSLAGYTDDLHLDLTWHHQLRVGLFGEAAFGGAWHDGKLRGGNPDHEDLGSRLLFHLGLEAGWRVHGGHGVSLFWEHLSNGSFASPNQGLDRFGARYGYRFD
jgi:hypothetical protein